MLSGVPPMAGVTIGRPDELAASRNYRPSTPISFPERAPCHTPWTTCDTWNVQLYRLAGAKSASTAQVAMGCIFSRPYHSSPSPELTSVHDKLQDGQVEMGDSSDKQTTATTAESTVARVVNIGASSATKATASHSLATAMVSGDEVDFVFSAIKKLLGSPQSAVDVQTLKVPTRNEAEVKLAQWSELGKVVVDWTTPLVAMLPFGPPMAAVIGGIYNRAAQAAINSANCAQLLELVQQCDRQLAKLYRGAQEQQGGLKVPDDARQGMRTMAELLVEAGHVMASYSRHGFLMRAIMSNIHKADFESLDADIRAAMQETCFAMTVELVITQGTYTDEMAAFRAAVCKAAGLPESKAEQAVKKLQQSEPELLLKLLQQHGSLADQVIVSELEALSAELKGLKLDMADVKSQLAQLQDSQDKAAARGPVALPKYLQTWWKDTVGRLIGRVANSVFLTHLVNWFKKEGPGTCVPALCRHAFDGQGRGRLCGRYSTGVLPPFAVRGKVGESEVDDADSKTRNPATAAALYGRHFLQTRSELNYLHQLGIEYAKTVAHGLPEGLPDLLDALFLVCFFSGTSTHSGECRSRLSSQLTCHSLQLKTWQGFDRKVATKKLESAGVLALMCSKLQASRRHAAAHMLLHACYIPVFGVAGL
ncbi:uncharacterized protein HaLaN_28475 [Haematococcus lacustris]|uniref:Uncharacterized protein n=1 Tax=Haematococcus lacustris TaxID=44745 RepID=A0A6A0AAD3_HAELA|nr:uncharacterized protein HaLaN_28475 [Haematococcus lacustris]